ncbi:cytosine permease [Paenarthrobacter sp. UW852]|uniref:purine-cytosine permease family protein n=1 Tax=Paenarthrobacter sp. UW852 TaxID=2951989 RepID=UPI0021492063|nr:cytosine permease [Paenarthrobacter sp. UW852]MCR1162961.1 cytosine permease [Paenarthrobacter sp. UW852]
MQDNLSSSRSSSAQTGSSEPGSTLSGPATAPGHDSEAWLQPIPESDRTRKVSGQFWIWAGANLAPINWVLGALGIHLGLGFADTVTVLVLGNLIGMLLFGCFVLLGQKTGATGMVLARAAFGRRGNYLPAAIQALLVIGWCAVNTWIILDLVMALFGTLGWVDPEAPNYAWKIGVATAIMAAQVAIAWFGYKAIAAFEKWTVPPTIIILAVMSAVAWFGMKIDWGYAGPAGNILEGSDRIAAMSAVMTAIGIGWGITWFTYAADYSRFVSTSVPKRKVYLASVLGQFIPVVWLGILGASLATNSGEIDPGKLIVQNFGVMALPVLLMVLHGPIATNILNIYTFSVATQALDININRRKLNLFVGVFSLAAVVFFIFQEDFAAVLDAWLIGLVAWVAAWGGVMLVHYFWLERRWPAKVDRLFDPIGTRRLPVVNWAGIVSLLAGIFCTWLFMYGLVPATQGPIAVALGGWDLSWLAGGLTSAAAYAVLGPRAHKKYLLADSNHVSATQPAPSPEPAPAGERTTA